MKKLSLLLTAALAVVAISADANAAQQYRSRTGEVRGMNSGGAVQSHGGAHFAVPQVGQGGAFAQQTKIAHARALHADMTAGFVLAATIYGPTVLASKAVNDAMDAADKIFDASTKKDADYEIWANTVAQAASAYSLRLATMPVAVNLDALRDQVIFDLKAQNNKAVRQNAQSYLAQVVSAVKAEAALAYANGVELGEAFEANAKTLAGQQPLIRALQA